MREVVVQHDRERCTIDRIAAPLLANVVQDVDGNGVLVHLVGDPVPIVQHVKAFAPRKAIVRLHECVEGEAPAADEPHVGSHRVAQTQERLAEVGRRSRSFDDLGARRTAKRFVERGACLFE